MKSLSFLLLYSILIVHNSSSTIPCLSSVQSSFKIYTVAAAKKRNKCKLSKILAKSLTGNGFTKVMCPFGILLVATDRYPDELLKYGANLVANLIDKDNDGIPDDEATVEALAHGGKDGSGAALVCGVSASEEKKEEKLRGLAWTFSCQTWKAGTSKEKNYKAIMFEEAFHMINEGWAASFPEIFGYDNFRDSLICRETARHQCVKPGWWHEENKCPVGAPFSPGNPAPSPLESGDGDCTEPSCDCFEFYRQAATLYMGWNDLPFWYSSYMPRSKKAFLDMASSELLTMMADPLYHQPQTALSGVYTKRQIQGSKGTSNGACLDNRKFRVNGKGCKWVAKKHVNRCKLAGAILGCKKSCKNCPCNQIGDDDNAGDDNESDDGGTSGEDVCEGHGHSEQECYAIGNDCCHYHNGKCWSAIGQDICKGIDTE